LSGPLAGRRGGSSFGRPPRRHSFIHLVANTGVRPMFLAIIHPGPDSPGRNRSHTTRRESRSRQQAASGRVFPAKTSAPARYKPFSPLALPLAGACTVFGLAAPAVSAVGPPEVVIRPAPQGVPPLTAQEKKRVQQATERGIVYLRRTQLANGSW